MIEPYWFALIQPTVDSHSQVNQYLSFNTHRIKLVCEFTVYGLTCSPSIIFPKLKTDNAHLVSLVILVYSFNPFRTKLLFCKRFRCVCLQSSHTSRWVFILVRKLSSACFVHSEVDLPVFISYFGSSSRICRNKQDG